MPSPSTSRSLALATLTAGAFTLLARELQFDRPTEFDRSVRRSMQGRRMRRLDRALAPLFPIGLPGALIPTSYLVARWLERRGLAGGPAIVTSAWLGWLGQRAIKVGYLRERPRRAGLKRRVDSYPSGHTTGTTAVAVTIASILRRRRIISPGQARLLAVGAPTVMGAYRVISDEHWATDVLGGWLFGATIALTCTALLGDAGGQSERGDLHTALRPRAPRVRVATG